MRSTTSFSFWKTAFSVVTLTVIAAVPWSSSKAEDEGYAPPTDPGSEIRTVTAGEVRAARKAGTDVLTHLFGTRAGTVARFNRIDPRFVRPGRRLRVPDIPEGQGYVPVPRRYRDAEPHERFILIVLDRQFIGAYAQGRLVASYPVSTGERGHRTPVGDTAISWKDPDHVSSKYPEPDGGWPMPWAMRFRGTAYWIHAGDLPGRAASHGCVRMFAADAEALYGWTDVGTPVRVVRTLSGP